MIFPYAAEIKIRIVMILDDRVLMNNNSRPKFQWAENSSNPVYYLLGFLITDFEEVWALVGTKMYKLSNATLRNIDYVEPA